ncbi:amidohydrolase family protein [Novosphingobium tardum]|uniref:Amidohydrolase family protein n=1 Tax=Novosphingobium tardum TaxID=1538021 RepID=A0ABV8RKH2_9SPHN
MKRLFRLAAGASLAAALAAPASAQDGGASWAITNATVVVGDGGEPIPNGTVVVRAGKVVAAGSGVAVPAGIPVIDAKGGWVTPGLVVAVTDIGLFDVEGVSESNDSSAKGSPFNAALDISPAINADAQHIQVSRAGGVTRAAVAPSGSTSVFAGQGAIIDLGADPRPIVRARAFQYVELGEDGARLAGGSRVSAQALFRNALREARDLSLRTPLRGSKAPSAVGQGDDIPADPRLGEARVARDEDVLLTRFDAAALGPVVNGTQPLYIHVERAADIRSVLALKREFPRLRMVLVGCAEGWLAAADISAAGVPVIAKPLTDLPAAFEQLASTQSNVGRMAAAGVKVALGDFNDQPRYAPQYAGNLVALTRMPGASGLTWGKAFAAISSVPAEIIGMGDRFGSLSPGHAGDVVIWDGDPLELTSAPVAVYIDGIAQPLDNHQTRLRERYRNPVEGALPKAYDW